MPSYGQSFTLKYLDEMISKIAKKPFNCTVLIINLTWFFFILLFYFPEYLDLGAICPGGTGFNLMTCDLYFMIQVEVFKNHILAKNMDFTNHREWTDQKNMFLKPANKYQIIWQRHISSNSLIADFHHHLFLCRAKVLWT